MGTALNLWTSLHSLLNIYANYQDLDVSSEIKGPIVHANIM